MEISKNKLAIHKITTVWKKRDKENTKKDRGYPQLHYYD